MKILIADDHWIVRDSLIHAVRTVGAALEALEAASFDEMLQLLRENPDIGLMLVDLVMPGFNEFEGLRVLRSRYPDIPIAVISVHEQRDHVLRAIEEGVIGYIPKSASGADMLRALTLVINGDVAFPRHILQSRREIPRADSRTEISPGAVAERGPTLTPREDQVLRLLGVGYSNEAIAAELSMRPNTVRVHIRNLSLKLNAEDRSQLAGLRRPAGRAAE